MEIGEIDEQHSPTASEAVPEQWDLVIQPHKKLFRFDIKELIRYKDLIALFVKRDLIAAYKQTVLGPLWFVIQPLLNTVTMVVVFGVIAKVPTDGLPLVLFYMLGIVSFNYFGASLRSTANTFVANISIFGKVYFPRLVIPISAVVSGFFTFLIQFATFLLVFLYYLLCTDEALHPNLFILATPLLILLMGMLGLGSGIIISALTTKYRDFKFLVGFGVQLVMYASPVIFPLSVLEDGSKLKYLIMANPVTPVIETMRYAFLGEGEVNGLNMLYSVCFAVVLMVVGVVLFNRIEKTFTDTV